jgi:hypothetical protein
MNKELEALLLMAAKATGRGVVGPSQERAAEFGVRHGVLVRAGEIPPGARKPAEVTGYHCKRGDGQFSPTACLTIDASSPGDGWTRYSVAELRLESTGHYRVGYEGCMTLQECKLYLRGMIAGAERR